MPAQALLNRNQFFILAKSTTNPTTQHKKNSIPIVRIVPSIIRLEISVQTKAVAIWIAPNNDDAVPLLPENGVIAKSVVVGNKIPIEKTIVKR